MDGPSGNASTFPGGDAMGKRKTRKGCEGCVHVSYQGGCDYLIHTGRVRPCKPGEGCTVKDTEKREYKPVCKLPPARSGEWAVRYLRPSKPAPSVIALDNDETALRLYAAGASDAAIARATGWGASTIHMWRKKTGRPANQRRKKDPNGSKNDDVAGGTG